MPNHVTNDIIFFCDIEVVKKIKNFMTTDESQFDFNKLIKYPKKFRDQDKKASEFIKKYGYQNAPADGFNSGGYDWCVENWGTKWNAYNISWDIDDNEVEFQTAWSSPEPIFVALKKKFPDVEMEIRYFDEDMYSSNRGCYSL